MTGDPGTTSGSATATAWQAALRAQFPIIVANPGLVFLDSAATSQKPQAVLDAATGYLANANANAGRGSYPWANATTAMIERAKCRVQDFLHDPQPHRSSVHFVSGATDGLHRVAFGWLADQLADGDEILVPFADHQANLVPWLALRDHLAATGRGLAVRALPYQAASGDYDHRVLPTLITPRTRLIAATHVHHVYGADMNIHRIRAAAGPDIPICLDAAQGIGHLPLSMTDLDVDFVVFSGHKALALPGTGAIWARDQRGPAFVPRGWAGTPNTAGIRSLHAALDWLDAAGLAAIRQWTTMLASRLTHGLTAMEDIEVLGCQHSLHHDSPAQRRVGIVAFRHRRIPSDDLGFILATNGIMVRSDTHCQGGRGEDDRSVRVSTHVYNTPNDIDQLLDVLTELTAHPGRKPLR
ncbi:MAG: aminotransferase class V-fold PLP-dependent enzyme [Dactylosporangium sp.]|nr:aminotransferase class V-fold PLP-dependent enzyme [Dactylosporangium sp.]NNJ63611.1 aminotransferase class V-fold PLP-dependent enzyme [Dactylosporangium sp.]